MPRRDGLRIWKFLKIQSSSGHGVEKLGSDHGLEKLSSDHGVKKLTSDHDVEKLGPTMVLRSRSPTMELKVDNGPWRQRVEFSTVAAAVRFFGSRLAKMN